MDHPDYYAHQSGPYFDFNNFRPMQMLPMRLLTGLQMQLYKAVNKIYPQLQHNI